METPAAAHPSFLKLTSTMALAGIVAAAASAQCTTPWLPGYGAPGTNHEVTASTMWDPDGAGPASSVLVVGGYFTLAGTTPASRIATYDPATGVWAALGTGMSGGGYTQVYALATLANGDLVAAGLFTDAGGVSANSIARWNGTTWSNLGSGMSGGGSVWGPTVRALVTLPNGDLIAAGEFDIAGGVSASGIARWNGTAWSPLGVGVAKPGFSAIVRGLAVLPNGDLVAGGNFTLAGGSAANGLARWNGASWSSFGSGLATSYSALTTMPNGDLAAAAFQSVERWNGTTWSTLAFGANGSVESLTALANGDLLAGGDFLGIGNASANRIARWNGTAWAAVGPGIVNGAPSASVKTITVLPNGELAVGGSFSDTGTISASYIARWNGAAWSATATGTDNQVLALTTLANGEVVAGGWFSSIGGVGARGIARWNGTTWSAMGSGMSGGGVPFVTAVVQTPTGEVVAGGHFDSIGGVSAFSIARWNGTTWSSMGLLPTITITALAALPNGDVLAGASWFPGSMQVLRWSNGTWTQLGPASSGFNGLVRCLLAMPNGTIVAGGNFSSVGGQPSSIAVWNGNAWSRLGTGIVGGVSCLALRANGNLLAGGAFHSTTGASANFLAEWNGSSWSGFGLVPAAGASNAAVSSLTLLPDGDVLAGGDGFALPGGINANRIARWNGSTWSTIGSGTDGAVLALASAPNGDVLAGGAFSVAGGFANAYLAQLTTTCPATATVHGSGCTGSGGANVLTATSLPWLGSTFHARGDGLPASALVSIVYGFSTGQVPLAALLPQGQPGCDLLVAPDYVEFAVSTTGSVTTSLAIPDALALVGLDVWQQLNPFDMAPPLTIVAVTASNALHLHVGAF